MKMEAFGQLCLFFLQNNRQYFTVIPITTVRGPYTFLSGPLFWCNFQACENPVYMYMTMCSLQRVSLQNCPFIL